MFTWGYESVTAARANAAFVGARGAIPGMRHLLPRLSTLQTDFPIKAAPHVRWRPGHHDQRQCENERQNSSIVDQIFAHRRVAKTPDKQELDMLTLFALNVSQNIRETAEL
jgi:hypothetical protein